MNKEQFWAIVDQVGWEGLCAQHDQPYEPGKERMLELLPTSSQLNAFYEHFSTYRTTLYDTFNTWQQEGEEGISNNPRGFGLGDDGFDDLIVHIIGCGHKEYKACLANPERAQVRAHSYDFCESFAYCVPDDTDYQK